MATAQTHTTALRRRVRYGLRTGVVLLAITASCMFIGLAGGRAKARIDVTAMREHRLSPRTEALLQRIDRPHEIVIAGNLSALDTASKRRSDDVLDALAHGSPHVRVTMIDTASGQGLAQYDAMLQRQVEASGPLIESVAETITGAARTAEALAEAQERVSELLLTVRRTVQPAVDAGTDPNFVQIPPFLEARAAMARLTAQELRSAAEGGRSALQRQVGRAPLPPLDESARVIRPALQKAADDASVLVENMALIAGVEQLPAEVRSQSRLARDAAIDIRDDAARAVAALDGVKYPPILAAARTLERSGGALVLGSARSADELNPRLRTPGVTAIHFDTLFPPRMAGGGGGAAPDQRFRAEELLATALGALNNPAAPIVVFVHGAPTELAPDYAPLRMLIERLRLRGMEIFEWVASRDPEPPSAVAIGGGRPVVFISISTYANNPEGAGRMARLAATVERIIESGQPLLLSVLHSTLPAIGERDPMVAFLAPLGVQVDSGRSILKQYRTPPPQGRVVSPEVYLADPGRESDHPIAATVRGLPMILNWPVSMSAAEKAGEPDRPEVFSFTPLLTAPADGDTWAEADWHGFWQIPAEQRGNVRNPPAADSARDDTRGPWVVAAALQRRLPGAEEPHRVVVVGSNGWFFDLMTQQVAAVVDGRTVYDAPGNAEFFEAAVYWLAGQDELIAASPAAVAVPIIPTIERLDAIRWMLIIGLPGVTLLCGVAYRLIRG